MVGIDVVLNDIRARPLNRFSKLEVEEKMKYIRTKEGIGEYSVDWNGASCVHLNHKWRWLQDIEKDIINQADTIEELCDEFVVWVKKECKAILPNYANAKMSYYNLTEIYGAIWTDKGLIYVAKMNEKGELELL